MPTSIERSNTHERFLNKALISSNASATQNSLQRNNHTLARLLALTGGTGWGGGGGGSYAAFKVRGYFFDGLRAAQRNVALSDDKLSRLSCSASPENVLPRPVNLLRKIDTAYHLSVLFHQRFTVES